MESITKVNALYYPNWRVYRGDTPGTLNYSYINYVFYAFAHVAIDGGVHVRLSSPSPAQAWLILLS